jgi:hypothetical protein
MQGADETICVHNTYHVMHIIYAIRINTIPDMYTSTHQCVILLLSCRSSVYD